MLSFASFYVRVARAHVSVLACCLSCGDCVLYAEAAANYHDLTAVASDESDFVGADADHCHCRLPVTVNLADDSRLRFWVRELYVQTLRLACIQRHA